MDSMDQEFPQEVASRQDRLLMESKAECARWQVASRQKAREIERMENEIKVLEAKVEAQEKAIQVFTAALARKDEQAGDEILDLP